MVAENEGKEGVWRSIWADGQLVGSISVERKDDGSQAAGEIGYMILTPWWSQGIGTEAVRQICEIAFQELTLEQIIGLGCERILTSGQEATVEEGADRLRLLRRRARGRIIILPGGGVTPENAARVLDLTGCTEIHASASVVIDGKRVTDARKVAAILGAING